MVVAARLRRGFRPKLVQVLLLLLLALGLMWAVFSWATIGRRTRLRPAPRRTASALVRAACANPPRTRGEIITWFADLLEENHIDYVLFWGTLLGAIRDGSIIPWTCDVDILIPQLFKPRNKKSRAQLFLEELICDDKGGTEPERCNGYCAFGKVNKRVFHVRFDPSTIETCPGESGGTVYLDVYGMMKHGRYKTKGIDWPKKSDEEARSNPSHYFFGSKYGGSPRGTFMDHREFYPINTTGALLNGRWYPTPRKSEVLMRVQYGKHWRTPDQNFQTNWCGWGWCVTSFGLERMSSAGGS